MRKARYAPGPAALAVLALAGCGGGVAPVSGVVTLDGQPLANASVTFQPAGDGARADVGGGSYAHTDASGRYTLRMVSTDQAGAVVGRHEVRISLYQREEGGGPEGGGRELLPARYNARTTLTCDVPRGGTQGADFALESDRDRPGR